MKLDWLTVRLCQALNQVAGPVETANTLNGVFNFLSLIVQDRAFFDPSLLSRAPRFDEVVERLGFPRNVVERLVRVLASRTGYENVRVSETVLAGGPLVDGDRISFGYHDNSSLLNAIETELTRLRSEPLEVSSISELIAAAEVAVAAKKPFHHHVLYPECRLNPNKGKWTIVAEFHDSNGMEVALAFVSEEKPSEEVLNTLEALSVQSRSGKQQEDDDETR